jgi:2-polyprenyl-3-methyl-5-hydroxy-6-metoxy-1,4-benzoquinol methylase
MNNYPKKLQNLLEAEIDPAFAQRAKLIFEQVAQAQPRSVLDIGCGRGFYVQALTYFNQIDQILGVDINQDYLDVARNNIDDDRVSLKQFDINQLDSLDQTFDLIILSEVLEHIGHDDQLLQKIRSLLSDEGKLVITVPHQQFPFCWDPINYVLMNFFGTHIDQDVWWLAGIWADHERLYELDQLKTKLKKNGYKVTDQAQIVCFSWPFTHLILYGLGKNLVERLNLASFDRFNFDKPRRINKFLARFMSLPQRLGQLMGLKSDKSANLFLAVSPN